MTVIKLHSYRRGLADGRAGAVFQPPVDSNANYEVYEIGYARGYNELLDVIHNEKLGEVGPIPF